MCKQQNLRERGEKYTNIKGIEMRERKVKPACSYTCFHLCSKNFSEEDRKAIHKGFWSLTDKEKPLFYSKFVKISDVQRRRKKISEKKRTVTNFFCKKKTKL